MTTLLCFGFGYCAEHYLLAFGNKFSRMIGTVRSADRARTLNETYGDRLQAIVFDGRTVTDELRRAVSEADAKRMAAQFFCEIRPYASTEWPPREAEAKPAVRLKRRLHLSKELFPAYRTKNSVSLDKLSPSEAAFPL